MNQHHERDLIQGARNFDLTILSAIYQQFSPGIFRYAMRLLGDECAAEDCVAETFSRFLKALRANQGPQDHLQAYLYRIAHNWITDCYRRSPPAPLDLDELIRMPDRIQPEAQAVQQLEQTQVRSALQSLTADQRQVVTLRFLEGWDCEEISAALGKPGGAVRALQFRALNSLRRLLVREEKEGEYEPGG